MSEPVVLDRDFVVVMGVAGSGKTSIGQGLLDAWGGTFLDSDDLCPEAARAKMSAGIPLQDEDRWPWIDRLAEAMNDLARTAPPVVLAWSGLKRRYREVLKAKLSNAAWWFFLEGEFDTIYPRLVARKNHFMRESMLVSQFEALEPPEPEEGILVLRVNQPISEVLASAVRLIQEKS